MKNVVKIPQSLELASLIEAAIPKLACTLRPDYMGSLFYVQNIEKSERGKEVLEQLVQNAKLSIKEQLPICQDTGYVWVCLEVSGGIDIPADIFSEVDAAVARAYEAAGLRMSLVKDALVDRSNSQDNTPAFCEIKLANAALDAPIVKLHIMLKGGGSDNASQLIMLPPGAGFEGVKKFVVDAVIAKGANACPPLVVGVGVGTTFDKVAGLAKQALLREVGTPNPRPELQDLETELLQAVNATGVGPGGLGGDITALALHLNTAPSHIAALPVAVNLGCCATRSITIDLA
jgi:tartrate/fumarate subfamily iron-sulfur-dependent hydro-lyase alpha chain